MSELAAGLDFGTSNSAIGLARDGGSVLHRFGAAASPFVPSALFFDDEDDRLRFGADAEACFLAGDEGRYLRALKSILGTGLIEESTVLGGRRRAFRGLLQRFLGFLKAELERTLEQPVTALVAGRPVRFADDPAGDRRAQDELEACLRAIGFREIRFLYEPVAALHDAAPAIPDAGLVLVADIGGGTSDFTLARRRSGHDANDPDAFEIMASHGVRTGGTDLDRQISLDALMPHLGHGSRYRSVLSETMLPVPPAYYTELASWHLIPFFYARARRDRIRDFQRTALEPEKLALLIEVAERRLGHRLAASVEQAKIALGTTDSAPFPIAGLPALRPAPLTAGTMLAAIAPHLEAIAAGIGETLKAAGTGAGEVGHLVLTGGTTLLPAVRETIRAGVPAAAIVPADPFCAVVNGLARAAAGRAGSVGDAGFRP